MTVLINKKYYTDTLNEYQGTRFLVLISKNKGFQFRWFTDCGHWFIYIHIGQRWCRFSSAGFLTNA